MALTSKLTAIGNAIRSKTGGSALLSLDDMVTAIGDMQNRSVANSIIDKSISGDYVNDDVVEIGLYTFVGCRSLETVSFTKATTVGQNSFGSGAAASALIALTAAHFPVAEEIETAAFRKASALEALVMDQITAVPTLANTNAFQDTLIASGTGYIYVPDALVNQVKTATNWSTFAAQIKGISDLPQTYKTKFGIS